jgi:hypothetical protein
MRIKDWVVPFLSCEMLMEILGDLHAPFILELHRLHCNDTFRSSNVYARPLGNPPLPKSLITLSFVDK